MRLNDEGLDRLIKPFIRTTEQCFEVYFPAFGGKFLNMLLMSPSNILVFLFALEEKIIGRQSSPQQLLRAAIEHIDHQVADTLIGSLASPSESLHISIESKRASAGKP